MAINKFMMAALKALSYPDIDMKTYYKANRMAHNLVSPPIKVLYKTSDHKISLDGYEIPVRIFTPKQQRSEEVLLFFHGGGWVVGNIDSYTGVCARLSDATGRRVISVDYRLAPEYPFPYAAEDCYAAAKEISRQYRQITLIGDSAGGNLAAVVSLMASQRKEFSVRRQILLYPATYNDHTESSPFLSVRENGTDYLLTSKRICEYIELYIQDEKDRDNPYFAPLLSDELYQQPDTLVITAEFDPLRDEGEAYARKLQAFGNHAELHRIPDALHGFFSLPKRFTHVQKALALINSFLEVEVNYEK